MSIQNYTPKDLTLEDFMELPKSIHSPIMTPSISFHIDQLYPILGKHLSIYLNVLQSYYSRFTKRVHCQKFQSIYSKIYKRSFGQ